MHTLKTLAFAFATAVSFMVPCAMPAHSQDLPPAAPKPKSQKEVEAIRAVQAATDPDAKLAAIDNVLTSFTDTEYKPLLLDMAVEAAEQKGDLALVQVWAERDLQSNPHSYVAMLAEANSVAASTKEFDLDKDQKLATAEKNAKGAIEELKTAQKPMPGIPDAQWEASKKQSQAQAYQILGLSRPSARTGMPLSPITRRQWKWRPTPISKCAWETPTKRKASTTRPLPSWTRPWRSRTWMRERKTSRPA